MTKPLLLQALQGVPLKRPPVWFMRQAGRFLPEYRALREKHSMLEVITTPELATEVTLQPLKRLELDAAIIFADILNPLIGMGVNLEFVESIGPVLSPAIDSEKAVEALRVPNVEENSGYTFKALAMVRSELKPEQALIGFAGAPFTLSSYLIEGQSSKNHRKTKEFMFGFPNAWHELQEKLVELVSTYLVGQVKAGAHAVQLFDSWLGCLGPDEYETFVAPYLKKIISKVKTSVDVPLIFFGTGLAGIFPRLSQLEADAFGVDWRIRLSEAQSLLGDNRPLQGNLDPMILAGPWDYAEAQVKRVLSDGQEISSHIFNVGHGILPHTPVDNVKRTIDIIKSTEG